jgi:hypothetical protein
VRVVFDNPAWIMLSAFLTSAPMSCFLSKVERCLLIKTSLGYSGPNFNKKISKMNDQPLIAVPDPVKMRSRCVTFAPESS